MKTRKALTLFDDYHTMMADPVRMEAYRQGIAALVKPGDVVLDLGSGLGILSLMALRAGAKKVIAIEKSDAIELARQVARDNGVEDRIEFVHGNSKDYQPTELADVLISETLGSFGVEENTLDFTLDARKRLLKPGGRMLPCHLGLILAPISHPEGVKKTDFWNDVDGFNFSAARGEALSRMRVETIKPEQIVAEPRLYAELDLETITTTELEETLIFRIIQPGRIDGLVGWFGVALTETVGFWTSPMDPSTHWKQAFFPFQESPMAVEGDLLEVKFRVGSKGTHSDSSMVSYEFRCTQMRVE